MSKMNGPDYEWSHRYNEIKPLHQVRELWWTNPPK